MGMRGIGATPKRTARRSRATALSRFVRTVYRTDKAGHRLIRTAVLSVARKNGKTQISAALCLCALPGPEAEQRGECYSVACTRFQAARVFNEMVAIITRVPWLNERINIIRFRKELEDTINGSTFAVLAADVAPVHGLSPSFVCYDELAQVPNRALYYALGTALGGRAEPLMIVISTQAARDEAPMSELIDYGLRIARCEITDPGFHLTLYTAPPEADPWKYATWYNSGSSGCHGHQKYDRPTRPRTLTSWCYD